MRVVGVSRVMNEAALVEPFIRHHAKLLDLHILLDNGSTDDTLAILRNLRAEGLPIQLYQSATVVFMEPVFNTGLYRLARQEGADWVVFLDCDELLDTRRLPGGMRPWLSSQSGDTLALQIPMLNHFAATQATEALANPFERLVRRSPAWSGSKILLRGLDPQRVIVGAGSHDALIDGCLHAGVAQTSAVLAHYPERSPLQVALKAAVGRLKVLADGQANAHLNYSWHLVEAFEALKISPRQWVDDAARLLRDRQGDLVEEPSPYQGGPLRYTAEPDDNARLVALLLTYAGRLAQSHGSLLDRSPGLRTMVAEESAQLQRLF